MDFADKNLTCADCGESFVFTAKDQEFYAGRGFTEPKRCPECRRMRKEKRGMGGEGGDRGGAGSVQYEVVCAECGKKFVLRSEEYDGRWDHPPGEPICPACAEENE